MRRSILTIPVAPHQAVRPPPGGLHRLAPVWLIAARLGGVLRSGAAQGAAPRPSPTRLDGVEMVR